MQRGVYKSDLELEKFYFLTQRFSFFSNAGGAISVPLSGRVDGAFAATPTITLSSSQALRVLNIGAAVNDGSSTGHLSIDSIAWQLNLLTVNKQEWLSQNSAIIGTLRNTPFAYGPRENEPLIVVAQDVQTQTPQAILPQQLVINLLIGLANNDGAAAHSANLNLSSIIEIWEQREDVATM